MEDASSSPPASYSQRARRLAAVAERRRLNLKAAANSQGSSPIKGYPSQRPGSPPRASPKKDGGSLAYALQQASCQWDGARLSAPSLAITSIGTIPDCYRTATALYLGRNALASLEGLQQFPALTTLSLSDNQLQQAADVSMLAVSCPALVSLALEGSPLSRLPHARAHVLCALPQLQQLDGVMVRARDRVAAAAAVQQEDSCMALMVSNACVVHKLARAAELLQLHCELRRVMHGRCRALAALAPAPAPLDVLKLLRLWDYEAGLSTQERGAIAAALQREVVRVHRQLCCAAEQLGPPGSQLQVLHKWGTAFSQVMLAQQRTITQLLELVTRLHAAAAAELAALQRWPDGAGVGQEQQQLQEREALISDLRDTAWELAQHIVSSPPGRAPPAAAAPRLAPSAAAAAAEDRCDACGGCLTAGGETQGGGGRQQLQCLCPSASDAGGMEVVNAQQQLQQCSRPAASQAAGHWAPSEPAFSEDLQWATEEQQLQEGEEEADCAPRRLSYSPPTAAALLAATTGRPGLAPGTSDSRCSSHQPQQAGSSRSAPTSRWSLRPHRGSAGSRRVARSLQYEAEPPPPACSPGGTPKQPAAHRASTSRSPGGPPAAAKSPGPARQPATPSPVSPAASSISRVLASQRVAGRRSSTSSPPHLARVATAAGGSSSRRGSPHGSTSSRLGSPGGGGPMSPSARQLLRIAALLRCSQEWEVGSLEQGVPPSAAAEQEVGPQACRAPQATICSMCGSCLEQEGQPNSVRAAEIRRSSGSSSSHMQQWQQQQPARVSWGGGSLRGSPGRPVCPLHSPTQQGRATGAAAAAAAAEGCGKAGRLCCTCRLQLTSSKAGAHPATAGTAAGTQGVARGSGGGAGDPDPGALAQQPEQEAGGQPQGLLETSEQLQQQEEQQQEEEAEEQLDEADPAALALLQLTPLELVQAAEAAAQALFEGEQGQQQQQPQLPPMLTQEQEHQGLLAGWHGLAAAGTTPAAQPGITSSPGMAGAAQEQLQQQWALQQQQIAALHQQQAQLLQQLQAASSIGQQGVSGPVGVGSGGFPSLPVAPYTVGSPVQGGLSSSSPFASSPNTQLLQLLGAGFSAANTPSAAPQQSGWMQGQQQGPPSPWQAQLQQQQQQQQSDGWYMAGPGVMPYGPPGSASTTAAQASSQGSPHAWASPQAQQQQAHLQQQRLQQQQVQQQQQQGVPSPNAGYVQQLPPSPAATPIVMAGMAEGGGRGGAGGGGSSHPAVQQRARGPTLEDWSEVEVPAVMTATPTGGGQHHHHHLQQQQQQQLSDQQPVGGPRLQLSSRQALQEVPAASPPAAASSMPSRRSSPAMLSPRGLTVRSEGSELSAALATVAALHSPRGSASGGLSVAGPASPQPPAPLSCDAVPGGLGVVVGGTGPPALHDGRQLGSSNRAPSPPLAETGTLHSCRTVPAPSVSAGVAAAASAVDSIGRPPAASTIAAAAASTMDHVGVWQGATAVVSNTSFSRQHSFTSLLGVPEQQQQQQQQQSPWGLTTSRSSSPAPGGQPSPALVQLHQPLPGLPLEAHSYTRSSTGGTARASPPPQMATSPAAAAAAALAVLADSAAPKAAAAAAAITKLVAAAGGSRPGTPASLSRPLSRAASVLTGAVPAAGPASVDTQKQQQRPASPLQQLAELQQQLVLMAVDKASLAKQLQRAEQACAGLQAEVMQQQLVAEAATSELTARLSTAQGQLAEASEAASQQQQDQELLQERLQQVEAAWEQQQHEAARAAAVDALGKVSLCRRTLRAWQAAAQQQRAACQQEEEAAAEGRRRVLRRLLARWRVRAAMQAAVRGWMVRAAAARLRRGLSAWQQYLTARRHKAQARALAQQHLRQQRQRRALSHWRYAAWHAAQLLDGGSSGGGGSPRSSCSEEGATEPPGPYSSSSRRTRPIAHRQAQRTSSPQGGRCASPGTATRRQRQLPATPPRRPSAAAVTPGLFQTPASTLASSRQPGQLLATAEACHVPEHVQREVAARLLAAQQRQRWLVQRGWWGWVATVQACWQQQQKAELLLRWRRRRALCATLRGWRGVTRLDAAESALSQRLERVQEAAADRLKQEQLQRRLRACFCAWCHQARGAARQEALAAAFQRSRQLLLAGRALRALRTAVAYSRQQEQQTRLAARHEQRCLLRRAWGVWAGSVWRRGAEQRAVALAAQQKVARAAFLWHKASAAALRRIAAQQRATHLAERVSWRTTRWALQQWRAAVLLCQRDRAAQAAEAAGQQAAGLGEALGAAQGQVAALGAAKEEGEAARATLERQLAEAVEGAKAQQEASARQVQQLQQAATSEATALQQQLAAAQQATQGLQQQLAAASAARDALESELGHAHQHQQALVQQLASASQQRSHHEAAAAQQGAAAQAARSQVLQLSGQVKQLSARLTDTAKQLQEAKALLQQQAAALDMAQGSARDATLALAQQSLEHHQQQAALQQQVEARGAAAKQLTAQYQALRGHLAQAVVEEGAARDEVVAGLRAQLEQQEAAAAALQQQLDEAARQQLHQQAKATSQARRLREQLVEVQALAAQQAALLAAQHTLQQQQQQGLGLRQGEQASTPAAGGGVDLRQAADEASAGVAVAAVGSCSPGAATSCYGSDAMEAARQPAPRGPGAAPAAAAALGHWPTHQVESVLHHHLQQQQQQGPSWLAGCIPQALHTTSSYSASAAGVGAGGGVALWGEGAGEGAPAWPSRLASSGGRTRCWSSSSSGSGTGEGCLQGAFTQGAQTGGSRSPGRRQQEQLLIISHEDSQPAGLGELGLACSESGSAPSPPATSPALAMRRWGPGTSSLPPSPAAVAGAAGGRSGGGRGGSSRAMWRSMEELGPEERSNQQSVSSLIDYAKGLLGGLQ